MIEVTRDMRPISVRIGGHELECEEKTGCVTVPLELLTGLRLSDIPHDIRIQPVENSKRRIDVESKSLTLSLFSAGSASVAVDENSRRKLWDGETGYSPHALALRQALAENEEANGADFQDRDFYFSRMGDSVFLHYFVKITKDLEIHEAIRFVYAAVDRIHAARANCKALR